MNSKSQTLEKAGNRHQYNLNTIKVPKNLDNNISSLDVERNDVKAFNNFKDEFASLNNPLYTNL